MARSKSPKRPPGPSKRKSRRAKAPAYPADFPPSFPFPCADVEGREPVRMRVCRKDPRRRSGQRCDTRAMVAVACATPSADKPKRKQVYVVPIGYDYIVPKRQVDRAMRERDTARDRRGTPNCEAAIMALDSGRPVDPDVLEACNISDSYGAIPEGVSVDFDPSEFDRPNGFEVMWSRKGKRERVRVLGNAPGGKMRVATRAGERVVPRHELIGRRNGARKRAPKVPCSWSPLKPQDPYAGQVIGGDNFSGRVRGRAVAADGKGVAFLVGGEIVPRSRWKAAVRKTEKLRAMGLAPLPSEAPAVAVTSLPEPVAMQAPMAPSREEAIADAVRREIGPGASESVVSGVVKAILSGRYTKALDDKAARKAFGKVTGTKLPSSVMAAKAIFTGEPFM